MANECQAKEGIGYSPQCPSPHFRPFIFYSHSNSFFHFPSAFPFPRQRRRSAPGSASEERRRRALGRLGQAKLTSCGQEPPASSREGARLKETLATSY